jgi:flagellar biosynthesis GTPase FlhF
VTNIGVLLVIFACLNTAVAQSLGDVARENRRKKAASTAPSRVITEGEVANASEEASDAAEAPPASPIARFERTKQELAEFERQLADWHRDCDLAAMKARQTPATDPKVAACAARQDVLQKKSDQLRRRLELLEAELQESLQTKTPAQLRARIAEQKIKIAGLEREIELLESRPDIRDRISLLSAKQQELRAARGLLELFEHDLRSATEPR